MAFFATVRPSPSRSRAVFLLPFGNADGTNVGKVVDEVRHGLHRLFCEVVDVNGDVLPSDALNVTAQVCDFF